jgi:hypothetical protein
MVEPSSCPAGIGWDRCVLAMVLGYSIYSDISLVCFVVMGCLAILRYIEQRAINALSL